MQKDKTLAVWVDDKKVGLLGQGSQPGYAFGYDRDVTLENAVSLTMPVRIEGWTTRDLHPIFQMNLPEGALLESIRNAVGKIIGSDDISLLQATGGNQIGRNRFALPAQGVPGEKLKAESLDEILTYPDTKELFYQLVNKYALRSGVSGVQPKILVDAQQRGAMVAKGYIVKSAGAEFPGLAINEFLCMTAAKRAGLPVSVFYLSENGRLFVTRRFDIDPEGKSLGFEDMCSLQAVGTRQKYDSSYERLAKSLKAFISGEFLPAAREQLFATMVLSSMVRNGDAHLKNFGVLYRDCLSRVVMAPVFDIVTTTAYIKKDVPALTIDGSKKWWSRKIMEQFAQNRLMLTVGKVRDIFDVCSEAVAQTQKDISIYSRDYPAFSKVGKDMMLAWDEGLANFTV